jgi:hypothetical protein
VEVQSLAEQTVVRLGYGNYSIASFSELNKFYKVNRYEGACNHPFYASTEPCKHQLLCKAVLSARSVSFGSQIAEARVIELCRRVFAPVKKKESITKSHELMLDVSCNRHCDEELERAARQRHSRVQEMHDRGKVA